MKSILEFGNYVMDSFEFESGRVLENVNVEYGISGTPKYDEDGNITNAVVYCPTLKGGYSLFDQYYKLVYELNFDKADYFFIKITSLGAPDSCSPSSTGLKHKFPSYTFRDRVNFKRQFLAEKFNIKHVFGIVGEGLGGFEIYTWACEYPDEMDFIIVVNSAFKTYGYRYVIIKCFEAIVESSDDFYSGDYSVSLSQLIVAITRLLFMGYYSKTIFQELSTDEIDVLMDDYVDEGLFMDIHDFKSRNDCILEYDVSDKLSNIKAKSLIMAMNDFIFFNAENDVFPLKDIIDDVVIAVFDEKSNYYEDKDYSDVGAEIISFLSQFD